MKPNSLLAAFQHAETVRQEAYDRVCSAGPGGWKIVSFEDQLMLQDPEGAHHPLSLETAHWLHRTLGRILVGEE